MVLVRARSGEHTGIGWTYGPRPAPPWCATSLPTWWSARDALDVGGAFNAMVAGAAQRRPPRRRRLRPLRGRRRAVGPQGPAARPAAAPPARRRARRGPGLRQRRVHHLRRRPAARAAHRLGVEQQHPAGQDQDRRVVGHRTAARPGPHRRRPGPLSAPDVELYVDANGGYTAQAGGADHAGRRRPATCAGSRSRSPPTTSPGCAQVRDAVRADVAAGEYGGDLTYFRPDVRRRRRRLPAGRRRRAAAASPSGCGSPPSPPPTASRSPGTARPTCTCTPRPPCPTCVTWSGSTTTSASRRMLFDGTLDPTGGVLRPDPTAPGHGLTLREDALRRYPVEPR